MKRMIPAAVAVMTIFSSQVFAAIPAQVINVANIKAETGISAKDKAEKLALAGEKLLTPASFHFADMVFNDALKLDESNQRARLYKAVLKPLMSLKGIFRRLEPLVMSTQQPAFIAKYKKEVAKSLPFFTEGPRDIFSDRQASQVLEQLTTDWLKARIVIRDLKSKPIELNLAFLNGYAETKTWQYGNGYEYSYLIHHSDSLRPASRECKAEMVRDGVFKLGACPYLTYKKYLADYADLEVFQQAAAGQALSGLMLTAYDLSGSAKIIARDYALKDLKKVLRNEMWSAWRKAWQIRSAAYGNGSLREQNWERLVNEKADLAMYAYYNFRDSLTDKQMIDILQEAGGGALKGENKLSGVKKLGTDIVGAVRWVYKMRTGLCNLGDSKPGQRSGYVFENGICATGHSLKAPALHKLLAQITSTLDSGVIKARAHIDTEVNLSRIYEAPVANLFQVLPNQFDKQGNAVSLPDNSLNGVFPRANADKYFGLNK